MSFPKVPKYLILIGAYLYLHEPKYYKKIHSLNIIKCIKKLSKAYK